MMYLAYLALAASAVSALPTTPNAVALSAPQNDSEHATPPLKSDLAPAKDDFVSKDTGILGFVNGTSMTGACNITYNLASRGACVPPEHKDLCGSFLYTYRPEKNPPKPIEKESIVRVVDTCTGLKDHNLRVTKDSFYELGGGPGLTVEGDVFWKVAKASKLTRRSRDTIAVAQPGVVHVADIANPLYEYSHGPLGLEKRDTTSAWSKIFGTVDGGDLTGTCGIKYNLNSMATCVSPLQKELCGRWLWLYLGGDGKDPAHKAKAQVTDVCEKLGYDQLDVSWAVWKALGGDAHTKAINKVNWKVLPKDGPPQTAPSAETAKLPPSKPELLKGGATPKALKKGSAPQDVKGAGQQGAPKGHRAKRAALSAETGSTETKPGEGQKSDAKIDLSRNETLKVEAPAGPASERKVHPAEAAPGPKVDAPKVNTTAADAAKAAVGKAEHAVSDSFGRVMEAFQVAREAGLRHLNGNGPKKETPETSHEVKPAPPSPENAPPVVQAPPKPVGESPSPAGEASHPIDAQPPEPVDSTNANNGRGHHDEPVAAPPLLRRPVDQVEVAPASKQDAAPQAADAGREPVKAELAAPSASPSPPPSKAGSGDAAPALNPVQNAEGEQARPLV